MVANPHKYEANVYHTYLTVCPRCTTFPPKSHFCSFLCTTLASITPFVRCSLCLWNVPDYVTVCKCPCSTRTAVEEMDIQTTDSGLYIGNPHMYLILHNVTNVSWKLEIGRTRASVTINSISHEKQHYRFPSTSQCEADKLMDGNGRKVARFFSQEGFDRFELVEEECYRWEGR